MRYISNSDILFHSICLFRAVPFEKMSKFVDFRLWGKQCTFFRILAHVRCEMCFNHIYTENTKVVFYSSLFYYSLYYYKEFGLLRFSNISSWRSVKKMKKGGLFRKNLQFRYNTKYIRIGSKKSITHFLSASISVATSLFVCLVGRCTLWQN